FPFFLFLLLPSTFFLSLLSLHIPLPPTSTLFPYTTLFRSRQDGVALAFRQAVIHPDGDHRLFPESQVLHGVLTEPGIHLQLEMEIGRAHVNSSHLGISYAVFCLKKKKKKKKRILIKQK